MSFLIVFLSFGCGKKEAPKKESAPVVKVEKKSEVKQEMCADHARCNAFRLNEAQCRKTGREISCKAFVLAFKKLSVVNDCMRSFDTRPVPSSWVCDEDAVETESPKLLERAASTLSKSKYDFAKKFRESEEYKAILDGTVSEDNKRD